MSIRIHVETLLLVGIVLGLFLLAMLCLAYSLNGSALLNCSMHKCCRRQRRGRRPGGGGDGGDDNGGGGQEQDRLQQPPPAYSTLKEFIFEADANNTGILAINNNNMPTTMQQIFPDLLGTGVGDDMECGGGSIFCLNSNNKSNAGGNAIEGGNSVQTNAELREPLL